MKNLILSAGLLLLSTFSYSQLIRPPEQDRKVQLAILFDTSNSMDGLIDQAKSRIWNIVNEVSTLTFNGIAPSIEIAIYQYGNDGLNKDNNYIQQVLNLSNDMDVISQKLFGLRTNGGSEFCGAVIGKSLSDLNWSTHPNDLKLIYVAGNESFAQGPINYKEECNKAYQRGIFINTIYCGNYDQGVREFWKDGAACSKGDYFNIDSNKEIVNIDTPYDKEIIHYNDSLNKTYYGYGSTGNAKKEMQLEEDGNAMTKSVSVQTERTIAKSKTNVYKNASWDLIDAVNEDEKELSDIPEAELPEEFRGKTDEEKQTLLNQKSESRIKYQEKIAELAIKREAYIATEMKKKSGNEEVDDFGSSINESIKTKAIEIGYSKK